MFVASKPLYLTKRSAWVLITRIFPGAKVVKDDDSVPPDVIIYTIPEGRNDIKVTCENDWMDGDGLIRLTITDCWGCGQIVQKYNPKTLERVFE